MKLNIRVLQQHIRKGNQGVAGSCAIALALQDMGIKNMSVSGTVRGEYEGVAFETEAPQNVLDFINDFDEHKGDVNPQIVWIEIPDSIFSGKTEVLQGLKRASVDAIRAVPVHVKAAIARLA